jgi:uncharacterized protein YktA (UPF0223 family)
VPIKVDTSKINYNSSDYFLIHGFGAGVDYWIYNSACDKYLGFNKYKSLVDIGKAKLYEWRIFRKFGAFSSLNPFKTLEVYRTELSIATSQTNLKKFHKELTSANPTTIIAHSMGCRMLIEYYLHHKPNSNLEKIEFLNADVDYDELIPLVLQNTNKNIELVVKYCWWDQALLSSLFVNRVRRIGQIGWQTKVKPNSKLKIVNEFAPLLVLPNLHQSLLER